jgi:acetyl esterase
VGVPLHPYLQKALDAAAAVLPLPRDPVVLRAAYEKRMAALPRRAVKSVSDRVIPGPTGDIPVRVYRGDGSDAAPVVVFFHGGGFVLCSIETHDGLCREICSRTGAVVVSVGYALAPERKFPAASDECLAATRWIAANVVEFGGDASRLALAGDSAGGNLAAVTALRLRDEGGPAVAAQLLFYPVTDHHSPGTASYVERGTGYGLSAETMRWCWESYLSDPAEADNPHACPNRAERLDGLPPAYVVTAEYDPLRDEGAAYTARLRAAGVDATCVNYADMNHGFVSLAGVLDRADEALAAACGWLASRFAGE